MSYKKWATILTGIVCIMLAFSGSLIYPLTGWGLLEIIAYEFVLILLTYGILRLVYNRALLEQT